MKRKIKPKNKELTCCICSELIKADPNGFMFGHNAFPYGDIFRNRCCDQCNWNIVIPTRIEQSFNNEQPKYA